MTQSATNRLHTVTQKIPKSATGLSGSLFVHVDFTDIWQFDAVRFSEKGKDGSTLDNILTALGDAATDVIKSRGKSDGE
jgi:hypothetical protein